MRLLSLLHEFYLLPNEVDREITSLALDSRKITQNGLFIALKGIEQDGRQYIGQAISQGAVAVLVEGEGAISWQGSVPLIPLPALRQQVAALAARFNDEPAKKLRMIGITGTNGKTSCSHFIAQALREPCGVIGTLGCGLYGALGEPGLTTPDAVTLQANLAQLVREGTKTVAMEVSSHSIDQGRVNDIEFEIGIFTNLTQDHLDYHGSMQAYAAVKRRFLAELPTKQVVVNADDAFGKVWVDELKQRKPVFTYSTQSSADVSADRVRLSLQGIEARVHTPWGEGDLTVPLIGGFNLSNVLAVLTTLCLYGIPFVEVLARLRQLTPVPGRMQALTQQGAPLVVVDYAHTPDALLKVLQALRQHCHGKLICVFGCGGDRDNSKRPLMGQIAEEYADRVIITNDNPRHESPSLIAEQILAGFKAKEAVTVMLDRSQAIFNSIQWATANDCVLIAGKGAEHYQQIGDSKTPFDDVEVATKCITEKLNVTVVK